MKLKQLISRLLPSTIVVLGIGFVVSFFPIVLVLAIVWFYSKKRRSVNNNQI